jgi:ADP-ribose pyrophosphatase
LQEDKKRSIGINMQTWKTLSKTSLLSFGKWLTVESHTIELPDGQVIRDWPWVIAPDYVNVLAITPEGKMLLFRQVKYAVEGESLAPVGGYMEPGEDPLEAVQRELLEETGYEAEDWRFLGHYRVDANRGAGSGYMYLALGARQVAERNADDLEEQHLLLLDRAEVARALQAGEIKVLAWAANVALALLYLNGDGGGS